MVSIDGHKDRAGWRVCIAGTGGQGVLTAARLLGDAFVAHGHQVVSGQLHGMAQRGGSVQSSIIIDGGISPVIPRGGASVVLGFEPVETARALPYMSDRTIVYLNTVPVVPYILAQRMVLKEGGAKYPDMQQLVESIQAVTRRIVVFDATQVAMEAGSSKTLNIVMLGCLLGCGSLPLSVDDFWTVVAQSMPPRLAETNTKAFFRGVELGKQFQLGEKMR